MTTNNYPGYMGSSYMVLSYMGAYGEGSNASQVAFEKSGPLGVEVFGKTEDDQAYGSELLTSQFAHANCPDASPYLADGYLTAPYLASRVCVSAGSQVKMVATESTASQVTVSLYNTTNLRILFDFDSRGDDGLNWTATSTEPSSTDSFHIYNVNTDVVEQVWRSATGVTTGVTLDCDMGVFPSFLDTMAFLNHNLTTSAVVNVFLSDNPAHAPLGESFTFFQDLSDSVYIRPDLPTLGWRYMRITIDDPTNPMGFLMIGTIISGSSLVLTDNECFIQTVKRTPVSYTDSIQTEAFTHVKNFRGIRRKTQMTFKNMSYTGPNWSRMDALFTIINTTLKALWIPTPQFPLRYMTFAKLTKIPEETHNVISEQSDWVNFVIDTDEAQ
jgi:hypothetical protein